jgi:L-ascorbate metabolism protein UlaG (beta-lactamase superfamily)
MLLTLLAWIGVIIAVLVVGLVGYLYYGYRAHMAHLPKATFRELDHKPRPSEWRNDEVTFAWIGHSTILLHLYGVKIVTDPVLSEGLGVRIPGFGQIGPKRYRPPALTEDEIGEIDLILLSHAHLDHIDLPSLRNLANRQTQVITAKNTSRLIRRMGFGSIEEMEPGQRKHTAEGVTITSIQVRHWGNRFPWNTSYGYQGYLIEKNGVRIFYPGDTAYLPMHDLPQQFGQIDLMFVPIGAYKPDSYQQAHCTPEQAWQMFQESGATWMVPIHWDTFVLSREPVEEPIQRLHEAANAGRERILTENIGETVILPLEK